MLEENASSFTWVAATVEPTSAAGYQLATQDPVMPIGGFSGNDPSPTLVPGRPASGPPERDVTPYDLTAPPK